MVSTSTSIIAASVAVAACISRVNAHGYMLIPETQFDGSANSAWIVQIDPTWASDDWNGNSEESVTTYQTLAAENDVTYIRTLLDDTSLYGADCGYSNPDGTAQSIPTDSTATFSRAIQHVGPCEIWLDDTMVFHDDNCYADYGSEDVDDKSVFPVDYSQCDSGGCSEMRFYWLAFQGVDDETVWQVYKDCIPLSGSSSSTTTTTDSSTESEADTTTTTTTSASTASDSTTTTTEASTESTDSTTSTEAPSTESTSSTTGSSTTSSTTATTSGSATTASSGTAPSGSFGGGNGGGMGGGNGGGWSGGFGRHLKQ